MSLHRSSAWPLSWAAAALIAYATLHPLTGWHWPDSHVFGWLLPRQPNEVMDDVVANLLGYLPLGLVLCLAHLRSGWSAPWAACRALLMCSALSYTLELLQFTVPGRVPSLSDWVLNSLGAAWGVLAAITVHALGLVDAWHRLRERWFIPQAGHGLALLSLWPLGLLFPPPLPLGQGQLMPHVRIGLVELTRDTPFQRWLLPEDPLTLWSSVHSAVVASRWSGGVEVLTVAAGMLAPMCVACAVARPKVLRILLLSGLVCVGVGMSALSSALNFGPSHALSWVTVPALVGLLLGALAGAGLVNRSRTTCAVLGVVALMTLIALIHLAPPDAYYAQTLQAWENGRFIRFHGLSRWFGILWPYVALTWLLGRLWGHEGAMRGVADVKP
ncbi:MAG: VanZ family protein [Proteobacteria bacterium]|uniref:VanZ family protein n=1 Tax=Aquabacterium sp. TaxID=1872578 RepID=UPI0035C6768B|nr:VanZ family protein [Pseudomonadota bacterium]